MRRTLFAVLLAAAMLMGCAAEQSFRDGKQLLSEGKIEEGLASLEKAAREDPQTVEYRTYLQRQRDAYINSLLTRADTARVLAHYEEAEAGYRRVLGIDAANQRAQEGISGIQADRRHGAIVAKAEAQFKAGDVEGAQNMLHTVLAENPKHPAARTLQRQIDEKLMQSSLSGPTLKSAFKKPITLEFRDASLKAVFEVISRSAGINFIFDKDVRADLKTTIFVKNTTIEDVINLLMVTNQLDKKVLSDNTVLIYPNIPAKTKDYQELMVKSFYLANADVKQTLNMIKTLVKTKDIFIDEKLNLLVMKDTPEAIRLAEKLIAAQDMAEPEVTLEVEVLEVKRSRFMELGIQFPNQFSVLNLINSNTVTTSSGSVVATTPTVTSGQLTWDSIRGGIRSSQVGIPGVALNLRKEDSDTNLLANPSIRVRNREKAKIHIGDKVPVITTTSTANVGISESVSYLDVGLKLDVEPNIYLDNEVAIKVGLEVSNIVREIKSSSGTLTYQIGTRNAATVLRLKDGETQALAGLINDEDRSSANKIPGLGDLPLLGRLFSSHRDDNTKTEIVLLITPHIVRNLVRPEVAAMEFSSGTESSIGAAPLSLKPTANVSTPMPGGIAAAQAAQPFAPGSSAAAAQPVVLSLIAAPQVTAGKEFTVSISAFANVDIRGVAFDLSYDPATLMLVNLQEGTFLKQGGAHTEFKNQSGEKDGRVSLKYDRSEGGARGSGTLAVATFKALEGKVGVTRLNIENQALLDAAGNPVKAVVPAPYSLTIAP